MELHFKGRSGLADLIELTLLAQPSRPLGLSYLGKVLPNDWDIDETQVTFAVSELRRRGNLLGHRYPFDVKNGHISLQREGKVYRSLLCLAHYELSGAENQTKTASTLFESIAEGCLGNYFGQGTETVNFGWPSTLGRPAEFDNAIRWLATKIGIDPGLAYRSPRRKDGGVDIVIWRSFPDAMPGALIMLCQATVQKDFLAKARDIDRRLWAGWLATDVDPIVGLCVPFVLENNERWREVSRNSIPLDRLRLTLLAPTSFLPEEHALFNEIVQRAADFEE